MNKKVDDFLYDSYREEVNCLMKKAYIKNIPENDEAKIFAKKVTELVNDHPNKNTYVLIIGLLVSVLLLMDISEDNET